MRDETQMFDLIVKVAQQDGRIRAAYLNGSRANPSAPRDLFQDYDIVYVVRDTAPFLADEAWIDVFGPRLMLQKPEEMDARRGREADLANSYGYLILLADGNRIDLHLNTPEIVEREYTADSQTIPLLDKDGLLPELPPASDRSYWTKRPAEIDYFCCCNNFWWCLQNVAKGVWRDEIPYAKDMLDQIVRQGLNQMVDWWIGMNRDFQVSPGKMGKYYKRLLPEEIWAQYEQTYSDTAPQSIWRAVFAACALFTHLSQEVAHKLAFPYNQTDGENMRRYLNAVNQLPPQAASLCMDSE